MNDEIKQKIKDRIKKLTERADKLYYEGNDIINGLRSKYTIPKFAEKIRELDNTMARIDELEKLLK